MLNDQNYQTQLQAGYHLILFGGDGCANCVSMQPLLTAIVAEHPLLQFHHVEADHDNLPHIQQLAKQYEVMSVPTTVLVANSQMLGKVSGYQPREILEIWLETKIEEYQKNI